MRASKPIAYGVAATILASLVAGCSGNSQSVSTLPNSLGAAPIRQQPPQGQPLQGDRHFFLSRKDLRSMSLLKEFELKAEGKLPSGLPKSYWETQIKGLKKLAGRRPHFKVHRDLGATAVWTSTGNLGYLIGTTKVGQTTGAIDVGSNACDYPETVKVAALNIWTACEYSANSYYNFEPGLYQEYAPGGTLTASYAFAGIPGVCTPSDTGCVAYADVEDGAPSGTNVFALAYAQEDYSFTAGSGSGYGTYDGEQYGQGIYWEPAKGSSSPVFIPLAVENYTTYSGYGPLDNCYGDPTDYPTCRAYYMDVDSSGNVWFDGYFYDASLAQYGPGIAEITNPTTSPAVTIKQLFGGSTGPECPAGIYVSEGARPFVNIVDPCLDQVFRFPLVGGSLGNPRVMTGLPVNVRGYSYPLTAAFGAGAHKIVVANADYGFDDIGAVAKDTWTAFGNYNFSTYYYACCPGAALTPSDR
jgi:hypothetical protein